jgi:hypothetical protein
MKGIIVMLICFVFAVNTNAAHVSAAINDEMPQGDESIISNIVYERSRANQEYQQYIKNRSSAVPVIKVDPVRDIEKKSGSLPGKMGAVTGIVLLIIALLLMGYLYYLSKNRKGN